MIILLYNLLNEVTKLLFLFINFQKVCEEKIGNIFYYLNSLPKIVFKKLDTF